MAGLYLSLNLNEYTRIRDVNIQAVWPYPFLCPVIYGLSRSVRVLTLALPSGSVLIGVHEKTRDRFH
jgi:hypothetical protein